jgi:superfamily II DNA/RNA helicase
MCNSLVSQLVLPNLPIRRWRDRSAWIVGTIIYFVLPIIVMITGVSSFSIQQYPWSPSLSTVHNLQRWSILEQQQQPPQHRFRAIQTPSAIAVATIPTATTTKMKIRSSMLNIDGNTIVSFDGDGMTNSTSTTTSTTTSSSSSTFADLGIESRIVSSIQSPPIDWKVPTAIQKLAIPVLLQQQQHPQQTDMDHTDIVTTTTTTTAVWCEAPTGGGKTACYLLPLLQHLLQSKLSPNNNNHHHHHNGKVLSLILCPTRELVIQIGRVVQELVANMVSTSSSSSSSASLQLSPPQKQHRHRLLLREWNIVLLYGGVPRGPQQQSVCAQDGPIDILIATPGRLVDILRGSSSNTATATATAPPPSHSYDNDTNDTSSSSTPRMTMKETLLERRLLQAFDTTATGRMTTTKKKGKKRTKVSSNTDDLSLSLEQIQKFKLDSILQDMDDDNDDDGQGAPILDILDQLQYLVIDEADRLLSRTFETEMEQVLQLLTRSAKTTTSIPYTWLFSATFPKQIEPRVDSVLKQIGRNDATATVVEPSCVRISCTNSDRSLQYQDDISATLSRKLEHIEISQQPTIQRVGPASTITLRTIRLEKRNRAQVLRILLEQHQNDWDRVLVFVATRYAAEHVSRKLLRNHIRSAELHGQLDQDARTRRLQDLTKGKIRVLIATDVASRGLDIIGLPVVINYDLPRSPADFVHRIGRTGRAGRLGTAVTFVTPDSDSHLDLIERRYLPEEQRLVREIIPGFEPDEEAWRIEAESSKNTVPGTNSSDKGLAHDRMFGGIKGRRKSKKDRLREQQTATRIMTTTDQDVETI